MFDINKFKVKPKKDARYSRLIERVRESGHETQCIEKAVNEAWALNVLEIHSRNLSVIAGTIRV